MYDRTLLLAKSLMADRRAAADLSRAAAGDAAAEIVARFGGQSRATAGRPRAAAVRGALVALVRSPAHGHGHLQVRDGHRP